LVETTTKNYGWAKPELQHSPATWGGFLNTDLDSIDGVVFANQQGLAPIGSGAMWFSATPPTNWLICDGSSLDKTTLVGGVTVYAALFAVLGYTYGGSGNNFNLPNLVQRFPLGVGTTNTLATSGGASTVTLDATMMPSHAHTASQAAHTHPGSYQDAHQHVITTGSHAHNITTGGHAHTIPSNVLSSGGGSNAQAGAGWAFVANMATSTVGNLGGNTDTAGNLGGTADSRQPAVHIDTQQPGVTVNPNGGGLAHNNMPPFIAINFIIRYA
jgi:microcystin-dependent protein